MKKAACVWALILLMAVVGWAADKTIVLKVKVQLANVRTEPDSLAGVITQVKFGTLLESKGKADSYYEVAVTDNEGKSVFGFIHASVVDVIAGGEEKTEKLAAPEQRVEPVIEREPVRPYEYAYRPAGGFNLLGSFVFSNLAYSPPLDPSISKSSRFGFGALIGHESGWSRFCLELDAMLLPRGAVMTSVSEEGQVKTTISGYGLGAAIVAKIRFLPESSPFVLGGVDAGYALSQKETREVNGTSEEVDISEDFNRLYYGLEFGAGYEIEMSGLAFVFEGRYLLGLSNLLKNAPNNESVKSRTLVLMAGIRI